MAIFRPDKPSKHSRSRNKRSQGRVGALRSRTTKSFYVIDIRKAKELFAELRAAEYEDASHEGVMFERFRQKAIVSRAEYCRTEAQARMLAANGRTWREFQKRQELGEEKRHTYRDASTYACVERKVLTALFKMEKINWNVNEVRDVLFREDGEYVLPELCNAYQPPPMSPEDAEDMSASGVRTIDAPPDRISGAEQSPKPAPKRAYVILDTVEFNFQRYRWSRDAYTKRRPIHDGEFLILAAEPDDYEAPTPLAAKRTFRDRHFPEGVPLPTGKYLAIPRRIFDELKQIPVLPIHITRESLDACLREFKKGKFLERPESEDEFSSEVEELGHDPAGLVYDKPYPLIPFDERNRETGEDFERGELVLDITRVPPAVLIEFPLEEKFAKAEFMQVSMQVAGDCCSQLIDPRMTRRQLQEKMGRELGLEVVPFSKRRRPRRFYVQQRLKFY